MENNLYSSSTKQAEEVGETQHYPVCSPGRDRFVTIGYISSSDPFKDRKDWSGTTYKVREAIELSGCKVIWVSYKKNSLPILIIKILLKTYQKLFAKKILSDHMKIIGKLQSFTINKAAYHKCDYLFFSGQSVLLSNLKTEKPIIYYSDATFHLMLDYYWHSLASWNIKQGHEIEKTALHKSNIVIHSSKWASTSAIDFYKTSEAKCHVLEFGANLDDVDIAKTESYNIDCELRVLFSGVDWERKGAEIAIETVRCLNKNNVKTKLILVGLNLIPEKYKNIHFIENVGFLNKNIPEQYEKYISIIKKCHLLLLPTKMECAGIVFCEASAYGLPIFTYDTGGIANYVVDGCNGYRLSLSEKGEAFARKITKCINNNELPKLKEGGMQLYKEKLSWNSWAERFKEILKNHQQLS